MANLRVRDLDLAGGRLWVRAGKGQRDRVVPLHPSLKTQLEKLVLGKGEADLVFGLGVRSLGMKFYAWAKATNTDVHTHSMRHLFATRLVEAGANVRAVQELLGHTSLNTTQVYLHVTGKHLRSSINLLYED